MTTDRIGIESAVVEKINASRADVNSSAQTKIRAGIVGAGLMGGWHAFALEKAGGEVVGIADFDFVKAERLAANYPNASYFSEVGKMLAAQDLDVLHICSPLASHESIAGIAIEAGVHLLMEKPAMPTASATARLYDLAAKRGIMLCPVHQFAFQEGVKKAKKQLLKIGSLVHIEANICSAGGTGLQPEKLDLIAADILPHPLSLIQKFIESDISAVDWKVLRPSPGELRIFAQMGETSLSIFISMNARPTKNSCHLVGTNGTIHLDLFHGFSFIEPGKTSKTKKILHPFDSSVRQFSAATINLAQRALRRESAYPGLRQLIREFYEAVARDSEPPIKPEEAIAVAEIRDLLMARAGIAQTTEPG